MSFQAAIIVVLIAFVEIHGKQLDSGPKVLNESTKIPPQPSQKRYATKEIILYLTPSQIRALHEGKGLLTPQQIHNAHNIPHTNARPNRLALPQDSHEGHPNLNLQLATPIEPYSDHFIPIFPPSEYRQFKNGYPNIDGPQNLPHIQEPGAIFPELRPQIPLFIPQEPVYGTPALKEQWYPQLDHNRAHLKTIEALHPFNAEKSHAHQSDLLQYASKYNEPIYGLDLEPELKNQHGFLQAAAVANSRPVIVNKEISVNHSPVQLIKQVKVPVPTPVLIPVPEAFAVNIPRPYPFPLERIKPVLVPIVKTQQLELERPLPIEIEKHVPYPALNNLYAEKPYFLERVVPLEDLAHKSENFPNHSY